MSKSTGFYGHLVKNNPLHDHITPADANRVCHRVRPVSGLLNCKAPGPWAGGFLNLIGAEAVPDCRTSKPPVKMPDPPREQHTVARRKHHLTQRRQRAAMDHDGAGAPRRPTRYGYPGNMPCLMLDVRAFRCNFYHRDHRRQTEFTDEMSLHFCFSGRFSDRLFYRLRLNTWGKFTHTCRNTRSTEFHDWKAGYL